MDGLCSCRRAWLSTGAEGSTQGKESTIAADARDSPLARQPQGQEGGLEEAERAGIWEPPAHCSWALDTSLVCPQGKAPLSRPSEALQAPSRPPAPRRRR